MEIERAPFDLALCLEEALDLFAVPAADKNIELGYTSRPTSRRGSSATSRACGRSSPTWSTTRSSSRPRAAFRSRSGDRGATGRRGRSRPALPGVHRSATRGSASRPSGMDRLFKAFSQVDSSTTRQVRRHRPRPGDLPAAGAADGRRYPGRERGRRGSAFIFSILTEAAPVPDRHRILPAAARPLRRGGPVLVRRRPPDDPGAPADLLESWGAAVHRRRGRRAAGPAERPAGRSRAGPRRHRRRPGRTAGARRCDAPAPSQMPAAAHGALRPAGAAAPQDGLPCGSVLEAAEERRLSCRRSSRLFGPAAAEGAAAPDRDRREIPRRGGAAQGAAGRGQPGQPEGRAALPRAARLPRRRRRQRARGRRGPGERSTMTWS